MGTAVPIPSPKGFFSDLEGMVSASACLPGFYSPTIEVTQLGAVVRAVEVCTVGENWVYCGGKVETKRWVVWFHLKENQKKKHLSCEIEIFWDRNIPRH